MSPHPAVGGVFLHLVLAFGLDAAAGKLPRAQGVFR